MMLSVTKERIYLHAVECCVTTAITISPAPDPNLLGAAIRSAASRHGSLNCRVKLNDDGSAVFEEMSSPGWKIYIADHEDEFDWMSIATDQRAIPFDIENGELVRFFILTGTENTQLIISMHHMAGDGKSILFLIRDIFSALADPSIKFSYLPMEEIDVNGMTEGVKLSGMVGLMVKMSNKRWKKQEKVFSRSDYNAMFEKSHNGSEPIINCYSFPLQRLSALLNVCRKHDVSLTHAIGAALAIAWKERTDIGVTVSLRKDDCESMGNYSTGVTISANPASNNLWKIAEDLKKQLTNKLSDNSSKLFLMKFMSSVEPTLVDAAWYTNYGCFRHPLAQQMCELFGYGSRAKGISLSNVGIAPFDSDLGKYRLSDLWMVPPAIPNALRTVAITTLDGVMSITIQYADDGNADSNGIKFEDAMSLLEEATVE